MYGAGAGGCEALDWIKSGWQRPRGAGAESRSWVMEGSRLGGPDWYREREAGPGQGRV